MRRSTVGLPRPSRGSQNPLELLRWAWEAPLLLRLCYQRAMLLVAAAHGSGRVEAQRLAARAMHGRTEATEEELGAAILALEVWAERSAKSTSIEDRIRGYRAEELAVQLEAEFRRHSG